MPKAFRAERSGAGRVVPLDVNEAYRHSKQYPGDFNTPVQLQLLYMLASMIICDAIHELEFYGRWCLHDGASAVTLIL